MTKNNSYSELLKDPHWQKKRLEIMQRDKWQCVSCMDNNSELHVHHLKYSTEMPWDELDENLITLCSSCHKAIHYLTSSNEFGFETLILVMRLLDKLESESINNYILKNNNV